MLRLLMLKPIFSAACPGPGKPWTALAQRMEKNLRAWKNQNPQGKIIATLGIGADGHTAGIFPFADNSSTFLLDIKPRGKNNFYTHSSPKLAAGYSVKVLDKKEFDRLFNGDNWVIAYDAKDKHQYNLRVTATLTFIKLIDIGIAYVCGVTKKTSSMSSLPANRPLTQFPAAAWHEIKSIKIFTDIK